jgi:5-methylcytosine-specific restriction protein B
MDKLYASKDCLEETIKYFASLQIQNHMHLGIFLFLKYNRIDIDNPISAANYKEIGLKSLWLLGGMFDENEKPGKRTCLFPFSLSETEIRQSQFYNGGTPFRGLLSRIKDTLDNTLVDIFLNKSQNDKAEDVYSLKPNYLETIINFLPHNKKISINYLTKWIYRFVGMEVSPEWFAAPENIKSEFSKVLIKKFIQDFNLKKEEINNLFKEEETHFTPSKDALSGTAFRALLKFLDAPELIEEAGKVEEINDMKININEVKIMAHSIGNNVNIDTIIELLEKRKQIILYGAPGTGKTWLANEIGKKYQKSHFIQFHPSYSYEEFIGGMKYDMQLEKFQSQIGIFLEICDEAKKNPENKYLLIIDEINRGNISKVFGEAITALEREYKVELIFAIKKDEKAESARVSMEIPKNLHILGTMNSADRSIALIDYALRRRFVFVKLFPNAELVNDKSDETNIDKIKIKLLYEAINEKIFEILKNEDLLLGQSYFLPKWAQEGDKIKWTPEVLYDVFYFTILPILEEYSYGKKAILEQIIGTKLVNTYPNKNEFVNLLIEQFPSCKKD